MIKNRHFLRLDYETIEKNGLIEFRDLDSWIIFEILFFRNDHFYQN
jgi:hypothetical protein